MSRPSRDPHPSGSPPRGSGAEARRPRATSRDPQAVRRRLLSAAQRLFAGQEYAGVTVRAIAETAGVNAAMIHYYFGDKQGLYEAVLEDTLEPLFTRLSRWADAPESEGGGVHAFVAGYTRIIAANRWIPALILREVLSEEGRLRERFVPQIARRGGGMLTQAIEREQAAGRLRPDLDPTLAALSLVSMTLFPFLALPIVREVFGVQMVEADTERLVAHTERMFLRGARS